MQKTKLLKLAGVALFAALSQAAIAVPDGNIHLVGEIVDAPCTISSANRNMIVPLGSVQRTALDGAVGRRGPRPTEFTLDLLACGPTATAAFVRFTGIADANDREVFTLLGLEGEQIATGVGVEIADTTGSRIPVGSEAGPYTLSAGDNALTFQANYVATLPTVTAGPAISLAQFTVTYP